ncbi:hypothetical protein [Roseimaritima multifibrata]|uniref:hypothetical protein n=1 Tax=Roseimaritima multifibrata TaxID=1930274 RepID=UPI0011A386F8|nr:hypothetical protein [Roseimaritima multifibrata]
MNSVAQEGLGANGDGFGSMGAVSLVFDTFCLVGLILASGFTLMRHFLAGMMERAGFVTGGLYEWASRQKGTPGQSNEIARLRADLEQLRVLAAEKITEVRNKAKLGIQNHETRLVVVEAKTADVEMPEPPPPPKTQEEINAELMAELKALKDEKAKSATTSSRRRTTKAAESK